VASLLNTGQDAETTEDIRNNLASGQTVEVAGYTLGGRLTSTIDDKKLSDMGNIHGLPILWLENLSEPESPLSPASQKTIIALSEQGNQVITKTVCAPPL